MKILNDLQKGLETDISILEKKDLENLKNRWKSYPKIQKNIDTIIQKQKNQNLILQKKQEIKVFPNIKNNIESIKRKKIFFSKTTIFVEKKDKKKIFKEKLNNFFRNKNIFEINLKNKINFSQKINPKKYKKFFHKKNILFAGIFILSFYILTGIFTFFSAKSGYQEYINLATKSQGTRNIQKSINDARFHFLVADFFGKPFYIVPQKHFNTAENLIKGGKSLSEGMDLLLALYEKNINSLDYKKLEKIEVGKILVESQKELTEIYQSLKNAENYYEKIESLGNEKIDKKLNEAKKILKKGNNYYKYILDNFEILQDILGANKTKKYLIIFQNNDEIRPMGGFMGSMGMLTLKNGAVKDFKKRDVYAYEWDLKSVEYEKKPAPEGINKLTEKLGLRDSNYFVTSQESSENIRFFMDLLGENVDGIIYLNQNIIKDLLEISPEINMKNIDDRINNKNFSLLMSLLVEAKIFKVGVEGTPKQILFDFVESFKEALLKQKDFSSYAKILIKHLESREVVFYSFDPKANNFLKNLGLNGSFEINDTLDFTYPIFTSISGNKSDRYIKRSFFQNVQKKSSCEYLINFKILQEHKFDEDEKEKIIKLMQKYNIEDEGNIFIQGNGPNKQFVRVLVPKEADVFLQDGQELKDYNRWKTVEFYTSVNPADSLESEINYKLKNQNCKNYNYHFLKQAGIGTYDFYYDFSGEKINITNHYKDIWIPKTSD